MDLALVRLSGAAKKMLEETLRRKVGLSSVPMLTMANSDLVSMPAHYDPLSSGANVIAVGFPLGSEFETSTVGQVEGLKRVHMGASSLYIAHTASIQQGNSGGPLCFKGSQVVGINSMKATGSCVDGLAMAIPSKRILSYLPHLLDERQYQLSAALVGLASHLGVQGVESRLLDAVAKQGVVLGNPQEMATAYREAVKGCPRESDGARFPTLSSFMRGHAHKKGFHALFSKVSLLLHSGEGAKLKALASGKGFDSKLCGHCVSAGASENMFCVSAAPSNIVHSPNLGFDYKASSKLTRAALGVPQLEGGVVVSKVLPYGSLSTHLMAYDVISAVHTQDGYMKLDSTGEHFRGAWGLSLGLADLVDRAPLGTEIAFDVHRNGVPMRVSFTHAPLTANQRPAIRQLDASEAHLDAAVQVAGVTFKVLRMSDLANPRMRASPAAQYAAPLNRHLEKIVVAQVHPASAAFHNYSLMAGQIVSHVGQQPLLTGTSGVWRDFVEKLSGSAGRGGLALLGTECGGIDTVPVSETEANQLLQYLQASGAP